MHVVKKAKQIALDLIEQDPDSEGYPSTFLNDFIVRWSSSYKMLNRFYKMKIIVDEITCNPQLIAGIKKAQETKLKKLILRSEDWNILNSLRNVLYPFYRATMMLQIRKYETLPLAKVLIFKLVNFVLINKHSFLRQWNVFYYNVLKSYWNRNYPSKNL